MNSRRFFRKSQLLSFSVLLCCALISGVLAEENAAEATPKAANPLGGDLTSAFEADAKSDDPILVRSDQLTLEANRRVFSYKGNVEARRGELVITTDTLVGYYSEENKITKIVCEDNVVITRGADLRATSDYAVYNVQDATITLTEAPELLHKGSALTADRVTLFLDEDRSEAEGDVRAKVVQTEAGNGKKGFGVKDLMKKSGSSAGEG